MKKLILTVSLLMACVIWADEDVAAIKGLYKSWNEAVEASNIDGYINSLDDNITLIPPDGPIVSGTNNYRVFLGPVFDSATYKIKDKDYDDRYIEAAKNNTALKRLGSAQDVADAAIFLASNKASYITGQTLYLDGGYRI